MSSLTERPVVGVQAVVIDGESVLLGRREGTFGAGTWGLPGGHLEFGESFEEAASRELLEETGIKALQLRTMGSLNTPYEASHYVQIALEVLRFQGAPAIREPDRCSGLAFFPLDRLPEPLFPPSISFLDHVRTRQRAASKRYAEPHFLAYFHLYQPNDNVDRFVRYVLTGEKPATLVILLGRRGERRPRQQRVFICDDSEGALELLRQDIEKRIAHRYSLYNCFGNLGVDEVRSLLPKKHMVAFRSVHEDDLEPALRSVVSNVQAPLPFSIRNGD